MNKYYVRIPYSYTKYGHLTAFVYAEDEEEAQDLGYDCENRVSEDYEDSDNDGDMDYDYSGMEITVEEEDVDSPNGNNNDSAINLAMQLPCRYIEDLVLL